VSDAVLRISDVRLRRGARTILSGITLQAARGELLAVMGSSGAGKTTILRVVAGLEVFEDGEVRVDDVTLGSGTEHSADALRRLRRKVGLVFQFHCLFEHLSAIDNVCLAPIHAHRLTPHAAHERGRSLLAALGVDHRAKALPRELSGGEAQRVAIARALAVDPPLLLLDEPTASLDPARRGELGELLRRLAREGRTLVIATHDEEFARQHATRIVKLEAGVIV
jgi:ABC-type polar amino acid transport system ATPase subunit